MRKILFSLLNALPAKIGSALAFGVMLFATLWPQEARAFIHEMMSARAVRSIAIAGLVMTVIYWLVWLLLRPKSDERGGAAVTTKFSQHHSGSGHNIGIENLHVGRQPFKITDAVLDELAGSIDKSEVLLVMSARDNKSRVAGERIFEFLTDRGFNMAGMGHGNVELGDSPFRQPINLVRPGAVVIGGASLYVYIDMALAD